MNHRKAHHPRAWPALLISLAAVLATPAALSQYPQSPQGGAPGSNSGTGPGMGPGSAGTEPTQRWGDGITPGWSLMTPAERQEHQLRMRSMSNYDECKSYMAQHQSQMDARAAQSGNIIMQRPFRDVCEGMSR